MNTVPTPSDSAECIDRRAFLKLAGAALAGAVLNGCGGRSTGGGVSAPSISGDFELTPDVTGQNEEFFRISIKLREGVYGTLKHEKGPEPFGTGGGIDGDRVTPATSAVFRSSAVAELDLIDETNRKVLLVIDFEERFQEALSSGDLTDAFDGREVARFSVSA